MDSTSTLLDREPSLLLGGGRNEPLEISSDDFPKAIFLDRDGNFSILPPKIPINAVLTDDVDDQKNVTIAKRPPAGATQDISSQDEVVSQPKRRASRSRLRTVVWSDDDELVNRESKAVEDEVTSHNSREEGNDKSKVTEELAEEIETAHDIQYAQISNWYHY